MSQNMTTTVTIDKKVAHSAFNFVMLFDWNQQNQSRYFDSICDFNECSVWKLLQISSFGLQSRFDIGTLVKWSPPLD